ncbi:MAG: protein kinase [Sandaracinaceae bacterium]
MDAFEAEHRKELLQTAEPCHATDNLPADGFGGYTPDRLPMSSSSSGDSDPKPGSDAAPDGSSVRAAKRPRASVPPSPSRTLGGTPRQEKKRLGKEPAKGAGPEAKSDRPSRRPSRPLSKMGMSTLQGTGPLRPEEEDEAVSEPAPSEPVSSEAVQLDSVDMQRLSLVELPEIARYGKYELLGRIAYGGMAEIFLAREMGHEDTRRMMVVKRVLPHVAEDGQFVDMFRDEARLAMQLNHPNICHVYNFGEAEDTYFIAMEWVNGMPLSKVIRRARDGGGIPIPIILKIIAQVAEALDYAHRACDTAGEPLGVVHRDVSPQNIMVSYDGVVKLLDFGIAKATSHSTRTEAGVIKGKFAYMSPQQCVGEPIDSRADIFALGICLYEALTGKHAFKRKTEFETMTKIVGDPAPKARARRPEVPEEVEAIIQTALMKQPERRYQTAGDMQMAIESLLPTLGTPINSSRIGDYVSALFPDEVRDGPQLDTRLKGSLPPKSGVSELASEPRPKSPNATHTEAPSVPPPEAIGPRKKKGLGAGAWLGMGCLLLGLTAAGAALAWTLLGPGLDSVGPIADIHPVEPPALPPPVNPPNEPPVEPPVEPPPVEPPVATTGSVMIESDPPGATIQFGDREDAGETPLELGMIEPGRHTVRLTLEGHRPFEGEVVVLAGGRATLVGELSRIPERRPRGPASPPGQLSVNSRPWSKVYLGRRLLGTTPIGNVRIPSGNQRLRLVDRDGNVHHRPVQVPAGGHVREAFDLR